MTSHGLGNNECGSESAGERLNTDYAQFAELHCRCPFADAYMLQLQNSADACFYAARLISSDRNWLSSYRLCHFASTTGIICTHASAPCNIINVSAD